MNIYYSNKYNLIKYKCINKYCLNKYYIIKYECMNKYYSNKYYIIKYGESRGSENHGLDNTRLRKCAARKNGLKNLII